MIIDNLFTRPIFESQMDPITQFASNAHEEWRRNFDPTGTKPRVKKNSDGTEGDINVPFEKLHPDWKKENLAAGHAAHRAVKRFDRDMEKAAEYVHNEWMQRNPKAEYNAAQHVPYDDLPEDEKEKDRVHVRTMMRLMGQPYEQNVAERITFDANGNQIRSSFGNNSGLSNQSADDSAVSTSSAATQSGSSPSAASRAAAEQASAAAEKIRYTNPNFNQEYQRIEKTYERIKSIVYNNKQPYSANPDLANRQHAESIKTLIAADTEFAQKTNALIKQYRGIKEQGVDERIGDLRKFAHKKNKFRSLDKLQNPLGEEGVAEGAEDNDDIERLKAGNSTSDGIDMQDIRLMAGEGKLTKKTVFQAIEVIRNQKKSQDVTEGDLQEIQRTKGDEEGLSTKGQNWGKETLAKIKMLPGSQRFGYTAGDAGRAASFLTGADTIIELFDVKHPQDGLRKAGFLSLRSAPWFPIKNSYQVANVALDNEYRGTGLGQNLYGVAMKLLGMTIVADDTQTPQARGSWLRLSQVPGVVINGYTSVFPEDWALRNNRNEIYDDSAKRLISSLLKAGGQEIGKTPHFVYVSFPVGANADQNELQALQKGITIYSARHPEDGGTQNGLYARWGGQVNEQGDDPWGPQGNFAGDKPINVGDVTMKIIQVGDIVKYLGQRARVVGMSKNRKYSRISIESDFGGITKDVLTADLKQLGQGVKEGSKRKKKKTSRSLGRYFFPGYGYYGSGESGGGSGDGGGGESINRGVAEGEEQQLSLQQLATISDEALDKAYGYGRSSPGNTFGWQANLKSAAYAKQMIDKGITDIEEISDAIHKGWNVTAKAFVQDPDQFDDTEKLKAAGKLEAKLQQRERLMNINYSQLPDDEQEKDRVVARALLRAINGRQDVEEARMSAAQRLSNAWDKQRAKSDASLRRTPSSIPKSTPEPKKTDTEPKTVSESRVKRRALMAQMLNSR
jgi:hypothetical protein